jgi:hypothetical protein
MISARAESDQVMFVSDVFLLAVVQRVIVVDVVLYTAVFRICWTTGRQ